MRTAIRRPLFPSTLLCLALCLALAACSHVPRLLGGSPNENMRLDGEQRHEVTINVGRTLTLDMRDPGISGYLFAGTSFDPALLRLDGIEPFEGGKRMRYAFTTLAQGECDIVIKIRKPEPGYRSDVFKLIHVTIEK
ncbi:MAG: hypothetical protein AUJ49_07380 [Desulfovibrionaceae bacterium CG1_02_65_16]|nr:MAG: hypothetical protein AUJ49_07380 [Desulfovibrionaceae bacterium CG1_02_65_16]